MTRSVQMRADQVKPGATVVLETVAYGGLHRAENSYHMGVERVRVVRWEGVGDGTAWLVGQLGHRSGPYPRDYTFNVAPVSPREGERCSACKAASLPSGMMCDRDAASKGVCLRCCPHNHG